MELDLAEDTITILKQIADKVKVPADLLDEDRVAAAIEALVASYDAQAEVDTDGEGTPIDAAALKAAIQRTTMPDISTTFTQPKGEARVGRTNTVPFDQLFLKAPTNTYIKYTLTLELGDPARAIAEGCIELVFNQIPMKDWDTLETGLLLKEALGVIQEGGETTKTI